MPKHRACKSGGWHFVVASMVAFFTLAVVEPVAYSARPAEAQSGVIREIRVVGNRRVEPETVRTYLRFNAGDAYDAGKVDEFDPVTVRHRPVLRRAHRPRRCRRRRHDRREPRRQPGGLRGQPGGRQGDAHQRGAAQAPLHLHARQGAGGRPAHSRRLPAAGSLCRLGRAEDHRAGQQPRERRLRDQRGHRDQGPGDQHHRQQGVLGLPAQGHHHDDAVGLVRFPERHERLRSRPLGARPGASAAVLFEERLCRCAHHVGRCRACPRRLGLQHHLCGR